MRKLLRLFLISATLGLGFYLGLATLVAHLLSVPQRVVLPATPQSVFGLAYEEVRFNARGEPISLAGWFVPAPAATNQRRAVIVVHGKDGCRALCCQERC